MANRFDRVAVARYPVVFVGGVGEQRVGSPMDVYHGLDTLPPIASSVLTIGNFDGVHLAHRQLVLTARQLAAARGAPVAVLTFDPHPLAVVAPRRVPATLTPLAYKLALLREAGADVVVVARSEPRLLGLEPEAFVGEVVFRRFHPSDIVEGPSFGFGRGRAGDVRLLARLAGESGAALHVIEPMRARLGDGRDAMISSSLVRESLGSGRVEDAAMLLGRGYDLVGRVSAGAGRGRTLGFPTANLDEIDRMTPGDGVYAGRVQVAPAGGADSTEDCGWTSSVASSWMNARLAAISIGATPTFHGTSRRVEVHVLDFDGDLYGKELRVRFDGFLRGQRRFPSAEALVAQLREDVKRVRLGAGESDRCSGATPCPI